MKFINLHKLNQPIITRNLIILILLLYLLWLFKMYSGNAHTVYLHMWKYALGTFSFENDIYVQRSNQLQVSILYHLFKYLNINIDNDYVGFSIHILLCSISGFFLFKILKEFVDINETNASLVIIFALLTIGQVIVIANISSWIIYTQGLPTYFAHQLIFPFLWVLLRRKTFWLFILSSFMLASAVKASWFSVGIAVLYSLFFIRPVKKNIWILGPLAVLVYLSSIDTPSDYETRLLAWNNILERDTLEGFFHLQPKANLIALVISFFIYFLILKKSKQFVFKKLAWVTLISAVFIFIFGYIYGLYGEKIWPEPRIMALSPTRALGIYQLFFWILVARAIYKSKLYQIYKIALLSSIFYLSTLSLDAAFFSLLILALRYLIIKFCENGNFLNLKNLILNKSAKFSYLSTLLFFLILTPGIVYLFVSATKYTDFYAMKKINKWTMGSMRHDNERLDTALMLQKCDDFVLLDLKHKNWTSAIAGKSNYWGNSFANHLDKFLTKEIKKKI